MASTNEIWLSFSFWIFLILDSTGCSFIGSWIPLLRLNPLCLFGRIPLWCALPIFVACVWGYYNSPDVACCFLHLQHHFPWPLHLSEEPQSITPKSASGNSPTIQYPLRQDELPPPVKAYLLLINLKSEEWLWHQFFENEVWCKTNLLWSSWNLVSICIWNCWYWKWEQQHKRAITKKLEVFPEAIEEAKV